MEPITGRRRVAMSLMLAPVAAAALAAPAAAAPTWLAPFDVASADQAVKQPAAAFGPGGSVAFAWATSTADGVNAIAQARRPAGGPIGPGPALATENADEPVLAAAPDGTTYAAWTVTDPARFGEGAISVARLAADGSIAQQQVVSGADDAAAPEIAVAADGAVGVAWVASDNEDNGAVRAAVGNVGAFTVRTVSAGDNNASDPGLDFDDGGTLHVAWARLDSQEEGRIKVATVTRAGAVSGPTLVSPAGVNAGEPTVAAGASGEAVAWSEIGPNESGTVRVSVRSGAAGFPPGQPALGGGDGSAARLAEAPGGALRLAWVSTDAADRGHALVANVDGGVLSPAPATVSGGDDVTAVRLAYATTGDGVAVWRRELDPEEPDLADVRAAGFDAAGPQLLDQTIPAQAQVGVPAAFSVRAVDVWSAVAGITWLFGDGQQATGAQVAHTYDAPRTATVTVRATDSAGNAAEAAQQTLVQPSTPGATPTPTPTPTDTPTPTPQPAPAPAALRLDDVVAEFACIRYLGAKAPGKRAAFAFTLSEAATVSVRIQRRVESKPMRKCPVRKPGGEPGTYTDTVTVTAPAGAGRGRVETGPEGETVTAAAARHRVLRRKLRRGRTAIALKQLTGDSRLAPGTYIARISAQTADGRTSPETTIKFWVLNRRS